MSNRAWKYWVIGSILVAALWATASSRAEELAQPKAFSSAVPFNVYVVIGGKRQFVGSTPSERPLTMPPCQYWCVEPRPPVDIEVVRQEVEAQKIPGLQLRNATDAHLEHLKALTALQDLNLSRTQVTDAGIEHLKGLTQLKYLNLADTQVTDAGLEHLKGLTALRELYLGRTQVTEVGVERLKKSLPNVSVIWYREQGVRDPRTSQRG